MKNLLFLLASISILTSCVDKNPKLDEAKYMAMQKEYEAEKLEIASVKTAFYKEKQDALAKQLALFKKVKDSTNEFTGVSTDSTFYLKDVGIRMVNFPYFLGPNFVPPRQGGAATKEGDIKTAIFVAQEGNAFSEETFREYYTELYNCEDKNISTECTDLKVAELQNFLDLKYAFSFLVIRLLNPAWKIPRIFLPAFLSAPLRLMI